ncbi:MAG TPA: hypothetical protein PKZ84_20195 [Anaerolineae bacterium]|nr:hypothetical protein [Anaerolineae bacterium]HQI86951.1 hypothetical protein [Anaerolineae bacterium]
MHRKRKWLLYALLATGLAVVGLFFFTLNRGPLITGFKTYENEDKNFCLWCGDNRPTDLSDMLGTGLITLLILIVPSAHIALLITAAVRFGRVSPSRTLRHLCPHCKQGVEAHWKACPYCGEKLSKEEAHVA